MCKPLPAPLRLCRIALFTPTSSAKIDAFCRTIPDRKTRVMSGYAEMASCRRSDRSMLRIAGSFFMVICFLLYRDIETSKGQLIVDSG
jgi:hypothetical protein